MESNGSAISPGLAARRKRWLKVHLYLGLTVGALLVVLGITGSILVFHLEIDERLNPDLLNVTPLPGGAAAYRPVDELVAAAQKALPAGAVVTFGQYPRHDGIAFRWNAQVPSYPGASSFDSEVYHVFVDPYRAEVLGSRLVRPAGWAGSIPRTFIGFVFALHYALLLPRIGEPPLGDAIVAVIGLILIASLVSGLYLWWPKRGRRRSALTIKHPAHVRRRNFDLHKTAGVYFFVVLLGVFISGVYLNLRAPFYAAVRLFSPAVDRHELRSTPIAGRPSRSLGDVLASVDAQYPDGRVEWMYLPKKPTGTYTICRRDVPGISLVLSRRCIALDRYSGEVLYVQTPERATAGEHFIQWQWPMHTGQMFGLTGRWIVFASGLICPLLFGTGWYLWRRKQRGDVGRRRGKDGSDGRIETRSGVRGDRVAGPARAVGPVRGA